MAGNSRQVHAGLSRGIAARYGIALCTVAVAWCLRFALNPTLGATAPYITFLPAVVFAGWMGGVGAAVLAATVSVVVAVFLLTPPYFRLPAELGTEIVRTGFFYAFSVGISALIQATRQSRNDAERARDLLQTTLSSIGDAVIVTGTGGRVTFVNAVAAALLGVREGDATGQPSSEIFVIGSETGEAVEDPVSRVFRERVVITGGESSSVLTNSAGKRLFIEHTAAPIYGSNQELEGVVLVFRDVSERRRSEDALRSSEERLKLVLEAGQIGAWDWDLVENQIEWSDQVHQIHRIERGGFQGGLDEYTKLIHSDDRERVRQAFQAAVEDGTPFEARFRVVRPSGETRWVSTMGRLVRGEASDPRRMLGAITDITAQKQAEAHLRQQWSTFDTALSNTPDHHFIVDANGTFTYVNRSFMTFWQRSLSDVIGKNYFEIEYPPELAARILRQTQDVAFTRQPVRDQTTFSSPAGETKSHEYILVPILDAAGEVQAVAGSSRDITDRIRVEEALRESEERLNFALEAGGGVGTWDWDIPSGRIFANQPFASLFQVDAALAAAGAPMELFAGHIHADDRDRVLQSLQRAIQSGGVFAEEFRLHLAGGSRWVLARGRCHVDAAGDATRFPGVAFDITERKRADELLQESQERLRAIYDGTYEYIGLLAPDGTLLEANRASLGFAASTRDEVVGRKFWDTPWFMFTPGAPAAARESVARAAAGEFVRYEALLNAPGGGSATFDISFYPIRNDRGEVVLIVPEGRNITDLKQVEEELRNANMELTRVNRDLEEVAYVASHDLQEPLRAVSINTQLLLRDFAPADAKAGRYASSVRQGVERMDRLLKDLLKFSRAVHTDEAPVGLANAQASLEEALAVLRDRIEESAAIVIAGPLPRVRGETAQLAHVFQNLISNALKYSRRGVPPRIEITAAKQGGGKCVIAFRDNGIGFEAEHAEGIFGLFKRLHRDEYEGTGVGLAICKRIVERYGGRIWAESEKGKGSTFYVALPMGPEALADDQQAQVHDVSVGRTGDH